MTTGEYIKKFRQEKGLSQKELGERLGVSQQMIGQYESPNSNLKLDTVKRIADALEISLNEILSFEDGFKLWKKEKEDARINNPPLLETLQLGDALLVTDITEQKLISDFRQLNDNGQMEAVKRVQELTEIPRYTEPDKPTDQLNAAHADNYADAPENLKAAEEKIMDDEDF